ncbi:uncharacterized protein LOC143235646 [Tachypleus tridentatus]|uniref:uncharacterized protein LOC143235646 n=1 Tax=Tachypleus tridentatus TaxID=6853 RepID=UPI003FCF1CF7
MENISIIDMQEIGVEEDFFLKRHKHRRNTKDVSFRMLYYPPVGDVKIPHGTITFLFQDDSSGMELKTKSGEWIQATRIKGTVLVLVADLLSIWSNGLYPAT